MNNFNLYFSLVYENEEFIVINKKENINFHSEDGEFGVVVAAEKALNIKLYSVHRLDKMTSGLLLLAKSSHIAAHLSALFKAHQVQKYYIAITDKKPKKKQGLIQGGMQKSRRSMWKLTKTKENLAITQFFSFTLGAGKRLFIIKPKTGKTHQIRVALKSIGSAICGDPLYGEKTKQYDRGYLHAYQLEFTLLDKKYEFQVLPCSGELFKEGACVELLTQHKSMASLCWPKC
ncbi:pseudouridine synthase Rlu family protein [Psychromonas sp. CNPT3]|uniref:TIGR01621 family pseudouridine synthase n=1 Tax=Psychromonas sp. CNPT3 TaxID=314282 RepID=UPI00006E80AA|nr:TIGR01621 family pseudouridine synthase [Psychromonas sp. CNPT3]AGH80786.1 pseudouridine synthase Rlu family protein [Psychromonas sp. CNPT3]